MNSITVVLTVEEISRLRMAQVYLTGLTRTHTTGCACWLCEASFYASVEAGDDKLVRLEGVTLVPRFKEQS